MEAHLIDPRELTTPPRSFPGLIEKLFICLIALILFSGGVVLAIAFFVWALVTFLAGDY